MITSASRYRPWRWLRLGALLPFLAAASLAGWQKPAPKPLPPEADAREEALIQTPAGFARQGQPAVAEATGRPTFARVNVVGADGNYYEPSDHALAPWSLHRAGNRPGKGPIRYYGWFFYCPGEAVVRVPAGPVRVEV